MTKLHSLPSLLLLSISLTTLSSNSHADNSSPASPTTLSHTQDDLQSINQEIESLEKQLAKLRRSMLNSEIHAQPYMIDNWHEFAEDVNRTEDSEKEILAVKKKIQDLNEKKKLLIKNPSSK